MEEMLSSINLTAINSSLLCKNVDKSRD